MALLQMLLVLIEMSWLGIVETVPSIDGLESRLSAPSA